MTRLRTTLSIPRGTDVVNSTFATDRLLESLPGWTRDTNGNLIRRVGSGAPRRVVACGLDWHAFVVSRITDEGYLRLHRIGRRPRRPLWDQAHEGQQVRILTQSGPLVGVTGIANGHFAFQHRRETSVATADDLWLDVGAESADDVVSMGVRLLDPVVRHLPPWSYASEVAGPGAGARIGCAAVAAASGLGPAGVADVFIAHMDEVGYEIETIAPSGVMELRRRGGAVASAWEGQPAKLQMESGEELAGVFLTREIGEQKRPTEIRAWFGMNADELTRRGVRSGLGITGYKQGHRLGAHRFTVRSLDDRAGTTALLMALKRIDPSSLDHRVVLAWSVQEEGGLNGAAALAERFGAETRQVFSVDTFIRRRKSWT